LRLYSEIQLPARKRALPYGTSVGKPNTATSIACSPEIFQTDGKRCTFRIAYAMDNVEKGTLLLPGLIHQGEG